MNEENNNLNNNFSVSGGSSESDFSLQQKEFEERQKQLEAEKLKKSSAGISLWAQKSLPMN